MGFPLVSAVWLADDAVRIRQVRIHVARGSEINGRFFSTPVLSGFDVDKLAGNLPHVTLTLLPFPWLSLIPSLAS